VRKTIGSVFYLLIGLLLVGFAGGSVFAADNIDPGDTGAQYLNSSSSPTSVLWIPACARMTDKEADTPQRSSTHGAL